MTALSQQGFHKGQGGTFAERSGMEVVAHYGDARAEYSALTTTAGVLDFSFRSRLCLLGADRQKFLNGQVTNNIAALKPFEGCYAALITAKGKMQSDLYIYQLENELLLDFEPGLSQTVQQRLDKYIIADDVQVVDVAPHYELATVQGPMAAALVQAVDFGLPLPDREFRAAHTSHPALGELYLIAVSRLGVPGFDLFVPKTSFGTVLEQLADKAAALGGRLCGWDAFEVARIEAGIPRFGQDMDETNLPPEAGLEDRAISYSKGCYIGQEVIARIRTYGQVAKALRRLKLPDGSPDLPQRGDKLHHAGKEVGYVTSATASPRFGCNIALGYVRREVNRPGTELSVKTGSAEIPATVLEPAARS